MASTHIQRESVIVRTRRCSGRRGALCDEARVGGTQQVSPPGPLAAVRRSTCHHFPLAPSPRTSRPAVPVTSFYITHSLRRSSYFTLQLLLLPDLQCNLQCLIKKNCPINVHGVNLKLGYVDLTDEDCNLRWEGSLHTTTLLNSARR